MLSRKQIMLIAGQVALPGMNGLSKSICSECGIACVLAPSSVKMIEEQTRLDSELSVSTALLQNSIMLYLCHHRQNKLKKSSQYIMT